MCRAQNHHKGPFAHGDYRCRGDHLKEIGAKRKRYALAKAAAREAGDEFAYRQNNTNLMWLEKQAQKYSYGKVPVKNCTLELNGEGYVIPAEAINKQIDQLNRNAELVDLRQLEADTAKVELQISEWALNASDLALADLKANLTLLQARVHTSDLWKGHKAGDSAFKTVSYNSIILILERLSAAISAMVTSIQLVMDDRDTEFNRYVAESSQQLLDDFYGGKTVIPVKQKVQ